jgi:LPXTG-site transpeptidase (sortase) family protein
MNDKILPEGTHDLYSHLGVKNHDSHNINDSHEAANLNVHAKEAAMHDAEFENTTEQGHSLNFSKILKNIFPYALVFIASVAVFFLFLTNFSFKSLFSSVTQKPAASISQSVPANQLTAYNAWINSYFYDVSDQSVLDPNNDISGNGLTNYQKFLLGLDPRKQDTLGLGVSDTESLISGIDPLTGAPMNAAQKNLVASNIDLEAVSNRVTLATANSVPKVAGANTTANEARDAVTLDTNVSGEIDIPSLKIAAPLIWTKDIKNFETDLPNGLVHYPGTPLPGEIGTSYISGHSSNYVWIKGKYNNVFENLNKLKKYDSFTISAKDTSGKTVIFHYVVSSSGIFSANDQAQFANIGKSTVGLSTCWPVGTSANRLVVFAQLTQVER